MKGTHAQKHAQGHVIDKDRAEQRYSDNVPLQASSLGDCWRNLKVRLFHLLLSQNGSPRSTNQSGRTHWVHKHHAVGVIPAAVGSQAREFHSPSTCRRQIARGTTRHHQDHAVTQAIANAIVKLAMGGFCMAKASARPITIQLVIISPQIPTTAC